MNLIRGQVNGEKKVQEIGYFQYWSKNNYEINRIKIRSGQKVQDDLGTIGRGDRRRGTREEGVLPGSTATSGPRVSG